MLSGIDISYAQSVTPDLTNFSFVFVRAGYGSPEDHSPQIDSRWYQHTANVNKASKPLGAYWFWYLGQDNAACVKQFLAMAAAAGVDMLVLDLEGIGANTDEGHKEASDFIARVHAAGYKIGLYHSISGFPTNLGQDWNWVAWYGSPAPDIQTRYPKVPWVLWQNGPVAIQIDHDYFNGDASALANFIGGNVFYERLDTPGSFVVPAGVTAHGLNLTASGFVPSGHGIPAGSSGHFDFIYRRVIGTEPPTAVIHVTDGYLAGQYINTGQVNETVAPTQTYADGVAAGYAEAKAAAAKAVQAI